MATRAQRDAGADSATKALILKHITLGKSIVESPDDLSSLTQKILGGTLRAKKVDFQPDGDVRYWGVDVSQSIALRRLKDFGEECFAEATGKPPALSFIMVNYIDAERCPTGSGGGWHRDSSRRQYKAFAYLTDVEKESQGAFCFIPDSNSLPLWLVSVTYRMISGGHRYPESVIGALSRAGVARAPVLLKSGIPFFVKTSLIHRGMPVSEGRRMMATVYMFEDIPNDMAYLQ